MRAARSLSLHETRVEALPDPAPGPGEVVCRIEACGVCGSDVTDWHVEPKLPAVLGHEPAGVVTAVGEGVSHPRPGDRVALHHHVPCGECRRCRRGHETLCERFRQSNLDPGGFAEQVRVPAELVPELLPIGELDAVTATFV
ncbi:MAG TPA: alcohol dehydrogenase catalytic domain-containing protein, partial [Solirubrobacteraceae bacterium]|nr:alcohol dehydrogenase catalytic domain-containing protein [Solirubrobacteraceae bacterium]